MKSLYEYLNEARQMVDLKGVNVETLKAAFTELRDAFDDFGGNNDDFADWVMDHRDQLQYLNILIDAYGEEDVRHFSKMIVVLIMTADEFVNSIMKMPIDRKARLLGVGSEGMVFDNGDRIVKCAYPGSTFGKGKGDPALIWLKYAKDHFGEHPSIPRIYKYSNKFLVMEKLDVKKPKDLPLLNDFVKQINSKNRTNSYVIEFVELYEKVTGERADYGDISIHNIGVRPGTQDIVVFDP